jgi:2-polyprenyl-3-methyl-5-hydroxy-6-metoxy-1,4-benzoquinol methylase
MDAVIREESPRQPHEQPFSVERIRRLAQIERRHFWFIGRRTLILRLLHSCCPHGAALVLDASCGTGAMVELLAQMGVRAAGFDLRPEGLMATKRSCQSAWLFQAESACRPIADGTFDAALALDVLEHVDDRAMLAEIARVLRPAPV